MRAIQSKLVPLFLILLLILSTFPTNVDAANRFKDVKSSHWAYSAIEWAYNQGLTKGYPNGTFEPEKAITEAQFAGLLVGFDCSSPNNFPAAKGEHKASGNYRYLQQHQLPLKGYYSMQFRDQPISRGLAARTIAAFQGNDLSEAEAVQYLYKNDLATGVTGKNDLNDFRPKSTMTRAEAVVLIQRLSKKGSCNLTGLSKRATGKDDNNTKLPPNFKKDDTVVFEPPTVKPLPPIAGKPGDKRNADIDIEKSTLIANGVDATYVTVSFATCSGEPIPYDESLSFKVTSERGASLDNRVFGEKITTSTGSIEVALSAVNSAQTRSDAAWRSVQLATERLKAFNPVTDSTVEYERLHKIYQDTVYLAEKADSELKRNITLLNNLRADALYTNNNRHSSSALIATDGPDLTVKIIAPKSTFSQTDTISFEIAKGNSSSMNCYVEPVTVQLNYEPQAELRVEYTTLITKQGNSATYRTYVNASVVRPGGEIIRDYNGTVRFRSAEGASMTNQVARFDNGVAYTNLTNLQSDKPITDFITAEIDTEDRRYTTELAPILNRAHGIEVLYDVPLYADFSCSIEDMEVAFVLDESGSMKLNDKERERITKSAQLIDALSAPFNIAAAFNSKGRLLYPFAASVGSVKPTLGNVRESGGTDIGDGLQTAFSKFDFTNSTPKVAILLTDGKSSEKKINAALQTAVANDIRIFVVGLGAKKNLNEKLLQKIATQTGGHYYHVKNNFDIGSAFQSILSSVQCGTPPPVCGVSTGVFTDESLTYTRDDLFMEVDVEDYCGEIGRVILRFNSIHGDVDYELVHRGQEHFKLVKPLNQIANFTLYRQGEYIAYNRNGAVVGKKKVLLVPDLKNK